MQLVRFLITHLHDTDKLLHPTSCGMMYGQRKYFILFLYMVDHSDRAAKHGVSPRIRGRHAVVPALDQVASTTDHLERCVIDVGHWMSASRLRLNVDKTELLFASRARQLLRSTEKQLSGAEIMCRYCRRQQPRSFALRRHFPGSERRSSCLSCLRGMLCAFTDFVNSAAVAGLLTRWTRSSTLLLTLEWITVAPSWPVHQGQ